MKKYPKLQIGLISFARWVFGEAVTMNTADRKAYQIMKNNSCRTMYSAERDRNVGLVFVCERGGFFCS